MQPTPRADGRSGRLLLAAALILVLLVTVAVASHGGFGHGRTATPSRTFVDYAFTAFLVVFVLAIPVAGYAYLLQAREVKPRNRRRFEIRVGLALLTIVLLFALLLLRLYYWHGGAAFFHVHVPGSGHGGLRSHGAGTSRTYTPRFEWPVVAVAAAALLAAAVALLRRRAPVTEADALEANGPAGELAASIGDAIDDLEHEPDARRAVIAAYARMEGVLARQGLARRASETPLEYLRRALLGLTRSHGAVERLTALFELAKFSDRPVGEPMKRDAIDALRDIRSGLTA
jgi:hypothetical protein